MPAKQNGFVCKFRWTGSLRAMVSCNGQCEDFEVSDQCDTDLKALWSEVLEKSQMLAGLKLSSMIDTEDQVIQFTVEGYSDAHAELVSQLRLAVSEASTELDISCRSLLDASVERVNVAIEAEQIARDLRNRADTIAAIGEMALPGTESVPEPQPRPDPYEETMWADDTVPADAPLSM